MIKESVKIATVMDEVKDALVEKDQDYVWHALTQYKKDEKHVPKIFTRGQGAHLFDIDGKEYIDGTSGLWCVNVGYGQKSLSEAAYHQLNELSYSTLISSHVPAIELSEKINESLGYHAKVHYSNSGSEANEVAFKIVRQYQSQQPNGHLRYKIISRYRAYHGNTLGALSATSQAGRSFKYEPLVPGFIHIHPPYCYRCPYGRQYPDCSIECAQELATVINYEGEESVAAFIAEPIMSGEGVIVPPPEYLPMIAKICKEKGVLLIFDEVVSGFGRSGKMFGFQHWGVEPDIITFAKGLTSGYLPLSATACKEKIFEGFKQDNSGDHHFRHVNTFGGHPASCAVAIANIKLINDLGLVEQARIKGEFLQELLVELKDLSIVGDIRGKGLFVGIELVEDKNSKIPVAEKYLGQLIRLAMERGVIIGKNTSTIPNFSNVLILAPPLIVEKADLVIIVETLKELLGSLSRELRRS